ncbi:MAG: hypothetical protein DWH98_04140 [Planctomycetota bacterium]|nr:MAG: hypothetical protein DWH98_04140 [Planctomycetota bacterium]
MHRAVDRLNRSTASSHKQALHWTSIQRWQCKA